MNPVLGVAFHWLGGFASGSFYVPFRPVRNWSWETYWLVRGVFSWIIAPWLIAAVMTNDLIGVLRTQSPTTRGWTYLFGVLWELGGLTFGLTMRYLGGSILRAGRSTWRASSFSAPCGACTSASGRARACEHAG